MIGNPTLTDVSFSCVTADAIATPRAPIERSISRAGAELHLFEGGDLTGPTVVFVHGYPDAHTCWDEVIELLSDRFHVVAYDIRGVGASTNSGARDEYMLAELALDLGAVIEAVSGKDPVHLVGHDWGAFQCWEALLTDGVRERVASFTALAGPRLDSSRQWALRRLRRGRLRALAGQARRSWYIGAFQLPWLAEWALGAGGERAWRRVLRRLERVEPRPGHPADTFVSDARAMLALYRANFRGLAAPAPDRGPVDAPVQLIVATGDRYESTALFDDAHEWATRVWRRDLRSGHWLQRTHPQQIARFISELVEHVEGAPQSGSLRRARYTADRRSLARRLAVVTGAGSGIGRATAIALAADGAEVIAADVNLETAKDTLELAPADAYMHAIALDVGDGPAMEEFAANVEREHGVPWIVVNNAGIGIGGPLLETTPADWERVIDVNLWGVIHGCRLFGRMMVDAGVEGQIVNLASAAAYSPSRVLPAYSTTKAAVLMLSECLRAELAGAGIGVTAICPGIVNTNITRTTRMVGVDAQQEQAMQERGARAYAARGYPPDKVADAILRAVRRNPAVLPVTPEARVTRTMSQLTPGLLRAMARLDPMRISSPHG
jgi:NAD(P)-dependent dehydrogenase (short-subunit alcohol dehydrogenase family)/pimeloyl-ACP methyl ester carboxylesterase